MTSNGGRFVEWGTKPRDDDDDGWFREWLSRLVIRGDQAFLPGEVIPAEKRRRMRRRKVDRSDTLIP